MDDNINVDMNNKTEDVENAVESENVKETLEDVVLWMRSWENSSNSRSHLHARPGKKTYCQGKIMATKIWFIKVVVIFKVEK